MKIVSTENWSRYLMEDFQKVTFKNAIGKLHATQHTFLWRCWLGVSPSHVEL